MKKILLVMMMTIALCLVMAGCGGSSDGAAEPQEDVLVAESIVGVWECEDISMGEMTASEMEELFGMKVSEMASLTAYSDGTAEFGFLGDIGAVKWNETDAGYTIDMGNEKMQATLKDNKLTVISEESQDGKITMIFAYTGKASSVVPGWSLDLTDEQVLDMSNFMAGGAAVEADGKLYGVYGGAEYGQGAFCMAEIKSGSTPGIKNEVVILEDCWTNFLCEHEGAVYGIIDLEKIVKVEDGNAETIYEGFCDYLQVANGKIYFSGEDYKLYSIDLDGSNKTLVLDKKDMYYTYILPNDMIIYQNDPDNESLHVYDMKTKKDYKVTDEVSYAPVICGDYCYYLAPLGDNVYDFKRVDMYTGEIETANAPIDGVLYVIENGKIVLSMAGNPSISIDEWKTVGDGGYSGMVMDMIYSNGDVRILWASNGEVFIAGAESGEKESIGFNSME